MTKARIEYDGSVFGVVESFTLYGYKDTFQITAIVGLTPDLEFSMPYVWRRGSFDPMSEIKDIDKYLRAKKPIFTVLERGTILIEIKAREDEITGEITTTAVLLRPRKMKDISFLEEMNVGLPDRIVEVLPDLGESLLATQGSRAKFLKERVAANVGE